MKFDSVIWKEIKHIAAGVFTFDVILLAVITGLKLFSPRILFFVLGGSAVAVGGFVWLCSSIQSTLEKKPENVKGAMTKSYLGRMVLYAGWVVIAVKFGGSSAAQIAGALPVLFPSFTIKLMNLFKSFRKEKEDQ